MDTDQTDLENRTVRVMDIDQTDLDMDMESLRTGDRYTVDTVITDIRTTTITIIIMAGTTIAVAGTGRSVLSPSVQQQGWRWVPLSMNSTMTVPRSLETAETTVSVTISIMNRSMKAENFVTEWLLHLKMQHALLKPLRV